MHENAERDDGTGGRSLSTGRFESFSDGVFAIAITLLVLEISVPPGAERHLLAALLGQWPSYLAYVVSFATIGGVWLGHNVVTDHLQRVDPAFVRINLLLLLAVSLLPFPTRLLAEHVGHTGPERVAVTVYGLTLLAAVVLLSTLWRHAVRHRLVDPATTEADVRLLTRRLEPGLAGYVGLVVLGLFLPLVAVFGYLLIAFNLLVPTHRGGRRRAATGDLTRPRARRR